MNATTLITAESEQIKLLENLKEQFPHRSTNNNSLSIVGSSRKNGDREPNDHYPTPGFVVEELLKREQFTGGIWEPACGEGNISKVLVENRFDVYSSDLIDMVSNPISLLLNLMLII